MPYYPLNSDISFTPLDPAEEAKLFKKYHSRTPGSTKARDRIIQHYLKFVAKTALTCAKGVLPEEDAIGAGNLGLMQALSTRRFNPTRGNKFAGYLRKFVRGQVLEAMVRNQRVGSGPWHGRDEFGVDAALTGRVEDRHEWENKRNPAELAVDETQEDVHLNKVRRDTLLHAIRSLTKAEKIVIKRELSGLNQTEIAKITLGPEGKPVSRQAVGNLRCKALAKLRKMLASQKHDLL
jgi:RNA polymerase sigma factor (sigma-70 family)